MQLFPAKHNLSSELASRSEIKIRHKDYTLIFPYGVQKYKIFRHSIY